MRVCAVLFTDADKLTAFARYVQYYFPVFKWIRQYRWNFLRGDLIAALTMASFYIPMALSYASNLGHMPPINGLYAFAINPFMYALLGTCPQMVVGPEAAGSLLTGSVVTEAIKAGHFADSDGTRAAQVGGMVTGLAGAIILAAGLCRLGFLDSVLSRPFLRGFISSIGIVIFIDQLIPEMGLDDLAAETGGTHGSPLDKLVFILRNVGGSHKLTCIVSFTALGIALVLRELKRRLSTIRKMGWVVYFPDRFLIVVGSAVFAWRFGWEAKGVDILGDIKVPKGQVPFQPHFPFAESNFKYVNDAFTTSLIVALLGFFESCVAAKSLGNAPGKVEKKTKTKSDGTVEEVHESDGIVGMFASSNRELVALGVANLIGGVFMALPAFGGYGRSKVNKSTGGRTPMSSVFLSLITVICIYFLLPYFYYIPVRQCTLSGFFNALKDTADSCDAERSAQCHDYCRFNLASRRGASRHYFLLAHRRVHRIVLNGPHLPDHIFLVAPRRYLGRSRLQSDPPAATFDATSHPDSRPRARHKRLRQCRDPGSGRKRRDGSQLSDCQNPRATHLRQHRQSQGPSPSPRGAWHKPRSSGAPICPEPGAQQERHLRRARRHWHGLRRESGITRNCQRLHRPRDYGLLHACAEQTLPRLGVVRAHRHSGAVWRREELSEERR
jgi:MFS superfamily sulfate permease-like transporter